MKNTLIRLHTSEENAFFDCDFQDDITIKENTEIALHSLSIEKQNKVLLIDGTNDTISFQVSNAAGPHEVTLEHGELQSSTINQTLLDLQDKMNSALRFFRGTPAEIIAGTNKNTKETGQQIKVVINGNKKVAYQMRYGECINAITTNAAAELDLQNMSAASNEFKTLDDTAAASSDDLTHSNLAFKYPISLGTSLSRVRVKNFTNGSGDQSGFILGITREQDKINNNTLTLDDLDYAIRVKQPTSIIEVKNGKANPFGNNALGTTLTNFTSGGGFNDNDHLTFEIRESTPGAGQKMHLMHYRSGAGNATTLLVADIELRGLAKGNDIPYFFTVHLLGANADIKLDNVGSCANQYLTTNTNNRTNETSDTLVGVPINLPGTRARSSTYSVTMPSTVADFFGFDSATVTEKSLSVELTGNRNFQQSVNSDNYIVEMLNMPINTYDSIARGRKNILSYVPVNETQIDSETGVVQYTAPYPLFLPLSNQYEMTLRNIKARIVTTDFNTVTSEGTASINILLRH